MAVSRHALVRKRVRFLGLPTPEPESRLAQDGARGRAGEWPAVLLRRRQALSIIHVNQIKNQVLKLFEPLIDLTDLGSPPPEIRETFLLTRGLSAYAIYYLSGASPADAAASVTDAGNDNGLDAIYFDEPNKRLYLVQSKWIKSGAGEPDNGELKKFVAGVRDLVNLRFDRFNPKIAAKQAIISAALNDPSTRYEVVVAHTGTSRLAPPSMRDLEDLAAEFNDVSEVLYVSVLNQAELHKSLTAGIAGEPINLQIGLKSWGRKETPHEAYYGQVPADQVVSWWLQYRQRLFAKNLRNTLGETDVNVEMRQTIEQAPSAFWYFNNGITILTKRATRPMAGGAGNDFSTFHCEDISVVNGAQTVSTIGKAGEANPLAARDVFVPIRLIVRGDDDTFAADVTRTNNRQNRIENRDFVTLDPEQTRIRTELAIDNIDYQVLRGDAILRAENAFDLVDATTALACAAGAVRLAVQLKREVGKLWDDVSKAPYRELFNASVPGLYVWRCVQLQRRIDRGISGYVKRTGATRDLGLVTHGNRIIAMLVFAALPVQRLKEPAFEPTTSITDAVITSLVDSRTQILSELLEVHYSNSIVPTLFKNLKKCEHLAGEAQKRLTAKDKQDRPGDA